MAGNYFVAVAVAGAGRPVREVLSLGQKPPDPFRVGVWAWAGAGSGTVAVEAVERSVIFSFTKLVAVRGGGPGSNC